METNTGTVNTVAGEVAEAAAVGAAVAPAFGPYGLIASQALTLIEFLAKEAPDAYITLAKAFSTTPPSAADFAVLRAEVAALSLDN